MVDVLCPVVVGRDRELDAARSGEGSVVILVGEAGIGKSRLAAVVPGLHAPHPRPW